MSNFVVNPYRFISEPSYPDGIGSTGDADLSGGFSLSTSVKKLGTGSVFFDGTDGHATANGVATATSVMAMDTVGTVSCWFNSASMAVNGGKILFAGGDTNGDAYFQADFVASGNQLDSVCVKFDGDYGWQIFTGTDTISGSDSFTTWYLYTITSDGTSPKFWINGSDITSGVTWHDESDKSMWTGAITTMDNFKIACRNFDNMGNNAFYKGYIDDFGIWDKELSAVQIASLWNGGTGNLCSTITDGLRVYYNMDSVDDDKLINQAIP